MSTNSKLKSERKLPTEWIYKDADYELSLRLAKDLFIVRPVAEILAGRGFEDAHQVREFTEFNIKQLHNPMLLPDIKPALERLELALDNNESIFVWGDYDVDGITSTAIVVHGMKLLGGNVHYYIPHRIKDGYDIKPKAVDMAIENKCSLLMSVDCGIKAVEVAEYAKEKGMDLIITDHHHASSDGVIPDCLAVINPNRIDATYPFKGMAGCGIAFKLIAQLAKRRNFSIQKICTELLEYVALGTIADVAPMLDENRYMVHAGLTLMAGTQKAGMRALLEEADVKNSVDTMAVGFRLGPRLNAMGRIGDATDSLHLILEQNPHHARRLAEQASRLNKNRQGMQEQQLKEACALVEESQLDNDILVVSSGNWHPGVVGLIASQLTQKYGRPAMVGVDMPNGETKGSCRSYRDFHILNAMGAENIHGLFSKYGGHAFAAGFSIPTEKMPLLMKNINEFAHGKIPEEKAKVIEIDSEVMFNEINNSLYLDIKKLEPYGSGHPSPIFSCIKAEIHKIDLIGEKHLKLLVKDPSGKSTIQARWWGGASRISEFSVGSLVTLAFKLEYSNFGGQEYLQMTIEDMKLL